MRDVFYTLLVVWIIWKIMNGFNSIRSKPSGQSAATLRNTDKTTVDYVPPKKKSVSDNEGEYVDYEEIK